jgi:TFIIH basal transcription factor complex TTD-A subunit
MVRAIRGVLVECDPAIKSIIVNIDSERHDFIIEDLDEQRLVINENMMETLKRKLEDVSQPSVVLSMLKWHADNSSASRRPSRRRRCRTRTN